jgi:hypothetical protein
MSDPQRLQLLRSINEAADADLLRTLRDYVNDRMASIRSELPIDQFYTELNEAYDAMIKRAISLAEAHLARVGMTRTADSSMRMNPMQNWQRRTVLILRSCPSRLLSS